MLHTENEYQILGNNGKSGNKLHHPLKMNIKYQALMEICGEILENRVTNYNAH